MKIVRMFGFLMLIAALSVISVNAQSAAKVSGRIGTVEIQRGGTWTEARSSEQISPGEKVRTGNRSSAAIDLGPGKVATLAENTQIELRDGADSLNVRLESGNMRVVSAADLPVSARDTTPETPARPSDLDYQADGLNLTVNGGAARTSTIIIRGNDARRSSPQPDANLPQYGIPFGYSNMYGNTLGYSGFYSYPYVFANPGFVYPNIQNPYSGIMPGQIIPPMTNPMRPAVHFPIETFPNRTPIR
ncbi:MAG: hypothetical protein DMG13_12730 [Acidobacteria bacterium]|nr:MAG: hypothetical protein DMG13_12730 [Acidobacteriota bacterium]